MTNWMTAAGIAFIAGGLATLISLRTVLFGDGRRRRDRRAARAAQSARRQAVAALPPAPRDADHDAPATSRSRRGRGSRRRSSGARGGRSSAAGTGRSSGAGSGPSSGAGGRRSFRAGGRRAAEPVTDAGLALVEADPDDLELDEDAVELLDDHDGELEPELDGELEHDYADESDGHDGSDPVEFSARADPSEDSQLSEDSHDPDDSTFAEGAGVADDELELDDDRPGGLAAIGLAAEEDPEDPLYLDVDPDADDAPDDEERPDGDDPAAVAAPARGAHEVHSAGRSDHADAMTHGDEPAPDVVAATGAEAPTSPHRAVPAAAEQARPIRVRRFDRTDRRYGHRVDGWVRPQYRDAPAEPPAGEYWTPVPAELTVTDDDPEPSARGYGWPVPVERLPAVPPYEPATGFDLVPIVTEPTEAVPVWPPTRPDGPTRIRLPRSWAARNEQPAVPSFEQPLLGDRPPREQPAARDRRRLDPPRARYRRPPPDEPSVRRSLDSPEIFAQPAPDQPDRSVGSASVAGQPKRRPRPRPRPGPPIENDRSTVYVSRHAADPPR